MRPQQKLSTSRPVLALALVLSTPLLDPGCERNRTSGTRDGGGGLLDADRADVPDVSGPADVANPLDAPVAGDVAMPQADATPDVPPPAAPRLAVSALPLDVGAVNCGSTGTASLDLRNTGNASLMVSAATTGVGFGVSPADLVIAAGESAALTIQASVLATEVAGGLLSGTLTLTSNDAEHAATQISLTATARGGHLSWDEGSPAAASFGSSRLGFAADNITLVLRNTGNAPLGVTAGAPSTTWFSLSPNTLQTVAAGGTLSLTAGFTPSTTAPVAATADLTVEGPQCGTSVGQVMLSGGGDGPPVAPSTVDASSIAATGMAVSWSAASDDITPPAQLQYRLVKATTAAAIDTVGEVEALTGVDVVLDWATDVRTADVTGLASSSTYYFTVCVRDGAGNESLHAPVAFSTLDVTSPTAVPPITASNVTGNGVTVGWAAASDDLTPAASLEYKLVKALSSAAIDSIAEASAVTGPDLLMGWTAGATSKAVTGLAAATTHYFTVLVRDAAGNIALYGPPLGVAIPDLAPPTIGSALAFSAVTGTSLDLGWGAATDAVTPQSSLQYRVVQAGSSTLIDTAAEVAAVTGAALVSDWATAITSRSVSGLTPGAVYYFTVAVRDAAGNASLYGPLGRATGKMIYVASPFGCPMASGTASLDAYCGAHRAANADATAPVKALVCSRDVEVRRPCVYTNCGGSGLAEHIDWPLLPSTTYFNTAALSIGTTSSFGLFTSPLTSAIQATSAIVLTGIEPGWTCASRMTCADWTTVTGAPSCGMSDTQAVTGAGAFSGLNCNPTLNVFGLYCVEQ